MADLRTNLVTNITAGVVIGVAGVANKFLVRGVPMIYDAVVGSLGRWGEPVFAFGMAFALEFMSDRAPFLTQYRIPSRWFIYGLYRVVEESADMVRGVGFAYIKSDGSIVTDPSDELEKIYMQKGDSVIEVRTGSRAAVIGPRRFVAIGEKKLYSFDAPYELPAASGGG